MVRPGAANYNDLSVPDPATACGKLLYRAGGGDRRGKREQAMVPVFGFFFCAFDVECCVVCYGEVYQVFTIRTF